MQSPTNILLKKNVAWVCRERHNLTGKRFAFE